ncbi:hypothetical protein IW262DRAFT_1506271 [Armillaria fumosa]|nr:hypothetical protein IW262DRAFT_1506271 [Armillaria fumosa]
MANQTDSPLDLTDADKAFMLQQLGAQLDSGILLSLLFGIYTGVVAVTLGNILMIKSPPIGKVMIIVITLLYIFTTINFGLEISFIPLIFVNNAQSIMTEYLFSTVPGREIVWSSAIAGICSILTDATMVCNLALLDHMGTALASYSASYPASHLYNRYDPPELLFAIYLSLGVVFKIIITYELSGTSGNNNYPIIYSSSMLATTLWCTILIIYRIVTVAQAVDKVVGGGLRAYRHALEVFIESSALYSITMILYIGLYSRDDWTENYVAVVAAIARGIAPTLLVGRVAAGHARPDDSWQGSVISGSIHFGTHPVGQGSQLGSMSNDDLEAQATEWESDKEYRHHARTDSQGDTGIQSMIGGDDTEEQLETPEDSHGYKENANLHGDDLYAHPNGLWDDPNVILVVPKD